MIVLLVTFLAALLCPSVHTQSSTAWCYHQPSCNYTTWPQTTPQFCNGSSQSPIDIKTKSVQENSNLTSFNFTGFDDNSTLLSITNTGNYVLVTLDSAKMTVKGGDLPDVYNPTQMTVHWGNGNSSNGSEHTVDGKQYPMELQILNVRSKYNGSLSAALAANDSKALAVFSFFIEGATQNQSDTWSRLELVLKLLIPYSGNSTTVIRNQITMDSLLEGVNRTKYYRYQGSLTTPSCNEVVIWTVFKETIKVSQDFINRINTLIFFKGEGNSSLVLMNNNFRGVQPLNNRVVTSSPSAAPSSAATSTISTVTLLLLSRLF